MTLFLLVFNLGAPFFLPPASAVSASSIDVQHILDLTNQERQSLGTKKLKLNSKLSEAAYEKAYNMFEEDYWSHYGPNGETPWQFIKGAGYDPYKYAGENLAKGFATSEGVHEAWMASPTHRANIISVDYADIGIAVLNGKLQGENVTLVVQMFGTLLGNADNLAPTSNTSDGVISNLGEDENILSIKITSPSNGEVINSETLNIKGQVGTQSPTQSVINVIVKEGENELATTKTNSNLDWEAQPSERLKQGTHTLTATTKENSNISDSIKVVVDTIGPKIENDQIAINKNDEFLTIVYVPNESDVSAVVSLGDKVFVMEREDSELTVTIAIESETGLKISATDKNGNVTEKFLDGDGKTNGTTNILGAINSDGQIRLWVNMAFVAGMLLILFVQIYSYGKLKLLQHKAGYLFTITLWISLIVLSTVIKSIGVIS